MSTSPFLCSSSAFIWNGLLEKYEFYDSAQSGILFEPQDVWIPLLLKYAQTIHQVLLLSSYQMNSIILIFKSKQIRFVLSCMKCVEPNFYSNLLRLVIRYAWQF